MEGLSHNSRLVFTSYKLRFYRFICTF